MASRSLRQSSVAIRAIGAVETQNAARHAARHAVRHASTGSLAGGRFGGGQLLVAPPARRGGGATGGGRRAAVLVAQLIVQLIQLLAGCVHALRIADQAPARVRHQTCDVCNMIKMTYVTAKLWKHLFLVKFTALKYIESYLKEQPDTVGLF